MDEPRVGVIERLASVAKQNRVLSAMLVVYLVMSAAELVRVRLFDRPRSFEADFYPAETARLPRGDRVFRWTRGNGGALLRPLYGQIVRIPLFLPRPDLTAEGIRVEISIDGHGGDVVTVYAGGWQTFDYYLPALLGTDAWSDDPAAMKLDDFAVLDPVDAEGSFLRPRSIWRRPPDFVQVFTGWHRQPGPPSVWFRFHTDSTFVPAVVSGESGGDRRELGAGVGELLWLAELPPEGVGLHGWEEDLDGRFAWTKGRASLRVMREGAAKVLRVRMRPPPDPDPEPREVRLYWNADLVDRRAVGQGWTDIDLLLPARLEGESAGVLTVDVSRTWSPARAGVSVDGRELGVAISQPRWLPG